MFILIVVLIILITISFIFPLKSQKSEGAIWCQDNLRKHLYEGMLKYVQTINYGNYPSLRGEQFWEALREFPSRDKSIYQNREREAGYFVCPERGGCGEYGYCQYRGPNYHITNETPKTLPIAADKYPHKDGGVSVLYLDGTVKFVYPKDEAWEQANKYLTGNESD